MLASLLVQSCARQGNITGGIKDTTPPALDTLRSTPNYVVRFKERRIELTFDEWVVLKDIPKEVVISPPLDKFPKISLHKKTVIVDLGEAPKLRENTTYTINFGGAVRDLHESNPAKDLRYVFATGDAIDSLMVDGLVTDALTSEPVENATVMLYDQLQDSVILKEKPYYFAKTNKAGQFSIKNIKPGTFKAVAIDEGQTPNLKWNGTSERIGFPDQPLVLSDSVQRLVALISIFTSKGPLRMVSHSEGSYGVARVIWSEKAPLVDIRPLADTLQGLRLLTTRSRDTLTVWYDFPEATRTSAWAFAVSSTDTIRIKPFDRKDFILRHRMGPAEASAGGGSRRGPGGTPPALVPKTLPSKTINQIPGKNASITFSVPVTATDTSKWVVMADTLPFRNFTVAIDSLNPAKLFIAANWKPESVIKIKLLPGAVTGFYQTANIDTLLYQVSVMSEKQLGILALKVEQTKPGVSYLVEILNGNAVEREVAFVADGTDKKLTFNSLQPSTYTAKVTEDLNGNGKWDTGSYFENKQPELIFSKKLDALRPNWELEAGISVQKEEKKKRGN